MRTNLKGMGMMVVCFGMLFGASACAFAQDEPALTFDLDATYVSHYIWRGYDVFDDTASFQPSLNANLWDSGFSLNIWQALACGSGYRNLEELDYTVAYGNTFCAGEFYEFDFGANYIYYDFYDNPSADVDTEETGAGIAFTHLLPIGDSYIIPSYYVGKLWPVDGADDVAGIYHSLGLAYDWIIPDTDYALSFTWDINYNDGMFNADHDWSHTTFGLSTSVDVGPVTVTPFVNYQISMEDTVNNEDELYGGLSVSTSF